MAEAVAHGADRAGGAAAVDRASSAAPRRSATSTRRCPGSRSPRRRSRGSSAPPTSRRRASRSPASSPSTRSRCPGRRPAPDQLPQGGGHRARSASGSGFRRERKGGEWKPSSSRGLGPSSSGRSSRSASSASGSTRPGARPSRRCSRRATSRSSRSTSPEQVAGGADMLDVNVGDPLADEVALMGEAVRIVQGLTDLPLCLDSSVIEALEAGLEAYEGKALVNSVTGEDERLEAILPLVAKHGAAVIGLANDEDIPMEPEVRLAVAKKIVSAAGDYGIPPEDVVIDALAMPVGALPNAVTLFVETLRADPRAPRRQHDLRRLEHGLRPAAAEHARRRVPLDRAEPRADERDHGRPLAGVRRRRAGGRPPARPRRVGRALDRVVPREAGGRGVVSAAEILPPVRRRRTASCCASSRPATTARRRRRRASRPGRRSSTRRAGTGSRSTRPAAATAPARSARCASSRGRCRSSSVDPRAFSIEELKAGWRLACRAPAEEDLVVEVPPLSSRPKAALVGVGRHVILRPAVQKRYLELEEPTLEDQASDLERVLAAMDDVELRVPLEVVRTLGGTLRAADFKVTAVLCDDLLLDVEPGDTTGRTLRDRVRPRDDDRRREPARPRDRLAARRAVAAEQAAALRRRRDLARLGDDARSRCARAPAEPRARDARRARAGGVRGGRRAAGRGLRGLGHRQPDDDPDRARDRPRAALDGAVHDGRRHAAARDRGRLRRPSPRARAGRALPRDGRLRRRRHRRRPARDGPHARPPDPALHRRRHEQRDRARLLGAGARDRRTGRDRLSRPRRSSAACAPRTVRSRA